MRAGIAPIHILCSGYSPSEYERIRKGLIPHGSFVCSVTENWADKPPDKVDVILVGHIESSDMVSSQLVEFKTKYPHIIGIRCILGHPSHTEEFELPGLLDGFYIIEEESAHWALNLSSLIITAVTCQRKLNSLESQDGFYKQIFDKNPIPMSVTVPDSGMFLEVNKAFLQVYGYTHEEVIGSRSFDLNIFVSKEERDAVINTITREHVSRDLEVKVRTKDHGIINGLLSADILYRNGQELFLITMKDISLRKRIEEELKDNNIFITNILSNINEGILVFDTSLGYRVWNRYMEELTGIPASDILGKAAEVFNPDIEGDDTQFLIHQALQGITSLSKDLFYHIPSTGKEGWASVIYTPYIDSKSNINGVIVSVRDIHDRKRYEHEIIAHELHLRSIIDTVPVWILCVDNEKRVTLANTTFCSTITSPRDPIEGDPIERLFPSFEEFQYYDTLITKALHGKEVPFDKEIIDPEHGDRKKYLRGRFSPLKGQNGTIDGVVCVIIEITDLKVAQLTVESINSKLNLLSSITRHDILNSLTAVLGYLAFALEEKDPDTLKSLLLKAYQTALLIQEQAEFSRDYQDIGVNKPVWHNAKHVFNTAVKSLKLGEISIEIMLDDLMVYADPLLERVIYNLVDNALRYGKTVTRISSYWVKGKGYIAWIIEDNGVGVVNDMKDRIFRKGVGHNTGLGLFLTREILDITGLTISETGVEGEGARFEIHIPNELWKLT